MDEAKKTIRGLLGIDTAPTTTQTAANVIGGLLFGGGFLGALNAFGKTPKYGKGIDVNAGLRLGPESKATQAGLEADLGQFQAGIEAKTTQGLAARGITDPEVAKGAISGLQGGLSGAYAMARAELTRAKTTAGMGVSGALSTYQQALAQKQYESMMSNYYSKLGIWGSLGGLGAGLLSNEPKKTPEKPVKVGDTEIPGRTVDFTSPFTTGQKEPEEYNGPFKRFI